MSSTNLRPTGNVFGHVCLFVCLFVCLSVRPSDYLKSYERISMKLLPEGCIRLWNTGLDFGNDPDYDF